MIFAMPRRRRPSESKFLAENYARCKNHYHIPSKTFKKIRHNDFCNGAQATAKRKQIFSRKLCALQKSLWRIFTR